MEYEYREPLWVTNCHARDGAVQFFEDTHIYLVEGEQYTSATSVLKTFFQEFCADKVIAKMRASKKPLKMEYIGKSDEEIKQLWDDNGKRASALGTLIHDSIEKLLNGMYIGFIEDTDVQFLWPTVMRQIYQMVKMWCPFRTEWRIFSQRYKIAGTIDAVFCTRDRNELVLVDWKCLKKLERYNRFQKALAPLEKWSDCNFSKYTLQLNLYAFILEQEYHLKVSRMQLVCFMKETGNIEVVDVIRCPGTIQKVLTAFEKETSMT
jgi:hypothetical protein